jgi:hypothetical protein
MVRGFADAVIINGAAGDVMRDDLSLATCAMAYDTLAYIRYVKPDVQRAVVARVPDLSEDRLVRLSVLPRFSAQRCDASNFQQNDIETLHRISFLGKNREYFAITHSLGSYFLMDAQARHRWGKSAETDGFDQLQMFDQATIFMFANQVALLNLANLEMKCIPVAETEPCANRRLTSIWKEDESNREKDFFSFGSTDYVAFNDVDDDLGFELPPYLADVGFGRMINVSVRNPAFWSIPFIIRNPAEVHTRQEDNPAVVHAVINGITLPPQGAPRTSTPVLLK